MAGIIPVQIGASPRDGPTTRAWFQRSAGSPVRARPCTSRPRGRVHPGLRGSRPKARYRGASCHPTSRKEGDDTGKIQTVKKGRR